MKLHLDPETGVLTITPETVYDTEEHIPRIRNYVRGSFKGQVQEEPPCRD